MSTRENIRLIARAPYELSVFELNDEDVKLFNTLKFIVFSFSLSNILFACDKDTSPVTCLFRKHMCS